MGITLAAKHEVMVQLMAAVESNFSGSIRPKQDLLYPTAIEVHMQLLKITEVVSATSHFSTTQ